MAAFHPPDLDFGVHAETLAAVTFGAVLATLSGMLANLYEARVRRIERERSAALLIGEVISTLRTLLDSALRTMAVGERFGPITRRMLIASRRELDIYERNREMLVDIRESSLRVDIHGVMVRIAIPLDGVLASLDAANEADIEAREQAIEFLALTLTRVPPLVARLSRLAGGSFGQYESVFDPSAPIGAQDASPDRR